VRTVVTGGAGFIGSALARRLVSRGDDVTVLDDLSTGSREAVRSISLVVADVADPKTSDVIRGLEPDVVIHAAAQASVPRSILDPARDHAVNVDGTAHVIEGARLGRARRVVFISSGGAIYGETTGADELTPPAPMSPYGENKLKAEGLLAASGLSYAIARLSNVYGPGQRSDLEGGVVAIFVNAVLAGLPVTIYGDGHQRRDFVHVDDVAAAITNMADSSRDGVWNVATGASSSILDLLTLIQELAGGNSPIGYAPVRPGDVRNSTLSVEQIATDLGWAPTVGLRSGLRRMLAQASDQRRSSSTAKPSN
jgi:UDP-glucose 4-epimerase